MKIITFTTDFEYQNHKVRTVNYNNEIWFVAKDLIDGMGHTNITQALKHCEDEKGLTKIKLLTKGGEQSTIIINEANLYLLLMSSKKEMAKVFRLWISKDVLPSIRKTGQYSIAKKITPEEHAKREIQVQNSKIINRINLDNGGVEEIKGYCVESCKKITGKRPSEWKKIGKDIGLKSKQYSSGKEVLRNIDGLKKYACALSVSDNLRSMGYDLDNATEIAQAGLGFFDKLLSVGIEVNNK